MKKQILFLTLFLLAVFAGTNLSYAQYPGGVGPADYSSYMVLSGSAECAQSQTLECASSAANGPLNPLVGTKYDYNVTVTSALATTGTGYVRWYVTDDPALFTAIGDLATAGIDPGSGTGDYIMTNTASYNQADPANNADNTITLSWQSWTDDATKPVLLVAYVVGDNGCTDNIEVYRIQPEIKFRLNIAALTDAGTIVSGSYQTYDASECVSPIESAIYTDMNGDGDYSDGQLVVDYGENWVFFTINATDFADSWMPTFQLDYTGTLGSDGGLYADWAYSANATAGGSWNAITNAGELNTDGIDEWTTNAVIVGGQSAAGSGVASAAGGECIVVRVRVDHGTDPEAENDMTDGPQTIKLAVDGKMYDGAAADYTNLSLADLHDTGTGNACAADEFDNDWAGYTLTPRPDVTTNTNDATPTPQNFEPKNGD